MNIFLISLLIPVVAFASPLTDFCNKKIRFYETESYKVRNRDGRDCIGYWYLSGRIDSYYEILHFESNPQHFETDTVPYQHRGEPEH